MKPRSTFSQFCLLLAMLITLSLLFLTSPVSADPGPQTLAWTNPTYADGSAIAPTELALIATEIEAKAPESEAWTTVATAREGALSWTGTLPSEYGYGDTVEVRIKCRIEGPRISSNWSPYSNVASLTLQYPTPGAQKITTFISYQQ